MHKLQYKIHTQLTDIQGNIFLNISNYLPALKVASFLTASICVSEFWWLLTASSLKFLLGFFTKFPPDGLCLRQRLHTIPSGVFRSQLWLLIHAGSNPLALWWPADFRFLSSSFFVCCSPSPSSCCSPSLSLCCSPSDELILKAVSLWSIQKLRSNTKSSHLFICSMW